MKILFITDNFPPEVNAPATRTYEHAKEWIKNKNVKVTIVTCVPNFPHGNVYDGYKNRLYQKEYIDGIEVIRLWSYITSNSGFIKRVLDYISFAILAFLVGLFKKYDVIIATSPQFFTTWAAWGISKIKRKPWLFELRDLWPESLSAVGVLHNRTLYNILEKIELFLYKDCTRVIALTDAFKENLIKRGIDSKKIDVIPNGVDSAYFFLRKKDDSILSELGLENKFIVGYIGTHGMAHGLDFIVNSIDKLEVEDIYFLFIGDGAEKKKIQKIAKRKKLKNITFLPSVPKEKVVEYLSIIDVSLIPLKKSETFKTVIPSKIFEAAAMKKPILLGVEGQAQDIIEKYGAGVCFEPENEEDFLSKLIKIRQNKLQYIECQKGCEKLARDFNRTSLAIMMLKKIKRVTREFYKENKNA